MLLLVLEKRQYLQSAIPLYRGDRWHLDGQVVDRIGNVDTPKDITGAAVTAYFPASGGGNVEVAGTVTLAAAGKIRVEVSEAESLGVALTPNGIPLYCAVSGLSDPEGVTTVATPDEPLEISDRAVYSV